MANDAVVEDPTLSVWPSVLGAGLFALTPSVWEFGNQGEVFALNNLLCSALCYLWIRYGLSS
jgi:hypothetical protein